jgi:hypothetical protein
VDARAVTDDRAEFGSITSGLIKSPAGVDILGPCVRIMPDFVPDKTSGKLTLCGELDVTVVVSIVLRDDTACGAGMVV